MEDLNVNEIIEEVTDVDPTVIIEEVKAKTTPKGMAIAAAVAVVGGLALYLRKKRKNKKGSEEE